MTDFGADPALVASQSNPQAVSTKGFDPGEGRCRKHQPELIDALRGTLRCSKCGRIGWRSRGNRKFGMPPRINWMGGPWMEMFGAKYANMEAVR